MDNKVDSAYEAARGNARLRMEQWAKNPSCVANTISAVRNVRMSDVALSAGLKTTFGQSPFAIARGQQFELSLLTDQASRLLSELKRHKLLEDEKCDIHDLRTRANGGKLESLNEALSESRKILIEVAKSLGRSKSKKEAALCAGFTIKIPKGILLPEAILIIDVLLLKVVNGKPTAIVGEVKTYPDRGGHTDSGELSVARAQSGMYVHGLDLVLGEVGLEDTIEVSRKGMLILTRPGSNYPSIRPDEDLRYQALRAERGFKMLEQSALSLGSDLWAQIGTAPPKELVDSILTAPTSYCENCLTFCDLAPRCFEQSRIAGDPIILGENVKRLLGDISLHRALELLQGGKAKTEFESELIESFNTLVSDFRP